MASGTTHRSIAGLAGFAAAAVLTHRDTTVDLPHPVVAGGLAAVLTNLPDWLEPATNPHHRQFCHSLLFAAGLGWLAKRVYEWRPEEGPAKVVRQVLLVGAGAYLVHLALDACTPRGLPLIGR